MEWLAFGAAALLALVDAGFAGYRDGAGRDGRVFKAEFYRRAIRRGLRAGLATVAAGALWTALWTLTSPAWRTGLARAAQALLPALMVALGYAALVLIALAAWAIAEADLRSLASVIVLGPFTLLRPVVIAAMALVAVGAAPDWRSAATVAVPCLLQLAIGPWLGRAWRGGARACG
jgi:hypothetical protein